MADPTYLPPESVRPEVPGGPRRPSQLVELDRFPGLSRRVELNRRLLEGTCPFDQPDDPRRFTVDDVEMLQLVVTERFGAEAALLRHQAVVALGEVDDEAAFQRLVELAGNPLEHDSVRITALAALPIDRARELLEVLVEDLSPTVAAYVDRLRSGPTERRRTPGHVPFDRDPGRLGECGCSESCHCC